MTDCTPRVKVHHYTLKTEPRPFKNYKTQLRQLYNDVKGLKKFQLFRMANSNPGVLECRKVPRGKICFQDLRRDKSKHEDWSEEAVAAVFDAFQPLTPPPLNVKTVHDIHKKILPYVPAKFKDNNFYKAPTPAQKSTVLAIKNQRAETKKRKQPPRNQAGQAKFTRRSAKKDGCWYSSGQHTASPEVSNNPPEDPGVGNLIVFEQPGAAGEEEVAEEDVDEKDNRTR